jgi:2-(1,2-epoxy-1,2-dihydrophenyl)acetyl-CoA isomerase
MSAPVLLDIANGIATVTLNRPQNGNAINMELARALMHAMHDCERDKSVRVVTLSGAGKMFCTGGDLKAIESHGPGAAAYVRELLAYLHEALSAIARIPVPVIAGVHGAAAGAGFSLACATDLAIATQSSRFLMAYTKVGLTPDGSSTWYLPRIVGLRRAMQLTLLNRELTADEARDWGILNDVVADDALPAALSSLAKQLADGPTASYGSTKRLFRESIENPLETQLMHEMQAICAALDGGEAKAGMQAFLAKQTPKFR